MRHKTIISTILLLVSTLLATTPAISHDNSNEDNSNERKKMRHINRDIDLKPTVKITYGKNAIVAKSLFPQLVGDEGDDNVNTIISIDDFNQYVDNFIQEEVTTFKKEVNNNKQPEGDLPKNALSNNLRIDFNSSILNKNRNPLISIRFSIQGHFAGTTSYYLKHHSLNYDFKSGQLLTLSDLFRPDALYLDLLSAYSRHYLSKKLPSADREHINSGTAPFAENFKTWNLQQIGLLITFDQEQVASKKYGTQTVLVPYDVLAEFIAKDSPLGQCLSRKRSCLQQTVATGGFMSS